MIALNNFFLLYSTNIALFLSKTSVSDTKSENETKQIYFPFCIVYVIRTTVFMRGAAIIKEKITINSQTVECEKSSIKNKMYQMYIYVFRF